LLVTLPAVLAGGLAVALAAGLTGCTTYFTSSLFSHWLKGTIAHNVAGEGVLICSWSKNLRLIYCIQGLVLRPERWRHKGWLGDVVLRECLRADLAQLGLRPGSLEGSCRLRGRPAQGPSGGLWRTGGFDEVHCLLLWLRVYWSCRCLHPDVVVSLTGIACMLTYSRGGCS
jgi:hypothetical protein